MKEQQVITSITSDGFKNQTTQLNKDGWQVIPGTVAVFALWDEKTQTDRWQYVAFFERSEYDAAWAAHQEK